MITELVQKIQAMNERHNSIVGAIDEKAVTGDSDQRAAFIELTKQLDSEIRGLLIAEANGIEDAGPLSWLVCHCGRLHKSGLVCHECQTWAMMNK